MNTIFGTPMLSIAAAALLIACGGGEPGPDDAPADTNAGVMQDMEMPGMNMPGMGGPAGMRGGMIDEMTQHMEMMRGMGGDSMSHMLPMHRQMVANMIAQMNREMRDMNMTGDAAWTAAVDSVRGDLRRMPEMSSSELQSLMPTHRDRVMRLIEQHRSMMQNMEMQ